jgi:integrase
MPWGVSECRSVGLIRCWVSHVRPSGGSRRFRAKILAESPFAEVKGVNVRANKDREVFITRDIAQQVLDACPDAEWRALFALCRFGGLRCPSEVLSLTCDDIDWVRGRIRVPSPKAEHHEGGASRVIPIFPELRPHLEDAHELAEPGADYVITRYRQKNINLRTQLQRIIRKAGLEPWEKPFQNLRSTRETELAETFPIHVCCAWLGNSQSVARKHYLQLTDEHFQKAAQQAAELGGSGRQTRMGNTEIAQYFPILPTGASLQAPPVGLEPTTSRLTAGCSTN